MKRIKGNSSKWINDNKKATTHFSWQAGFGAFSVSKSQIDFVIKYIRNQEQHHKKKTFREEYVELLKKHNVDFDERYLWD